MKKFKNWLLKKLNAVSKDELNDKYILKEDAMKYVGIQPILPKIVNIKTADIVGKVYVPETYIYDYLFRKEGIEKIKLLTKEEEEKIINNEDLRGELAKNMGLELLKYTKIKAEYSPSLGYFVVVGLAKVAKGENE